MEKNPERIRIKSADVGLISYEEFQGLAGEIPANETVPTEVLMRHFKDKLDLWFAEDGEAEERFNSLAGGEIGEKDIRNMERIIRQLHKDGRNFFIRGFIDDILDNKEEYAKTNDVVLTCAAISRVLLKMKREGTQHLNPV